MHRAMTPSDLVSILIHLLKLCFVFIYTEFFVFAMLAIMAMSMFRQAVAHMIWKRVFG